MYTSGGTKKYTNPKSLTINTSEVTLKKGKSFSIKAKVNKLQKSKKLISTAHTARVRYKSTDAKVAKVSKRGKIKALGKGKCKIYVYAANGVRKTVRVTVR